MFFFLKTIITYNIFLHLYKHLLHSLFANNPDLSCLPNTWPVLFCLFKNLHWRLNPENSSDGFVLFKIFHTWLNHVFIKMSDGVYMWPGLCYAMKRNKQDWRGVPHVHHVLTWCTWGTLLESCWFEENVTLTEIDLIASIKSMIAPLGCVCG